MKKKREKDVYEIIYVTSNFPPTHEEIKLATRKGGESCQYWIKTANVLQTPQGLALTTLIIKKNRKK